MPNVSEGTPAVNDDRVPLLTERVRLALWRAGVAGCTTHALALEIYGESDYATRGKVTVIVQRLRRRCHVLTVRDVGYKDARYVLGEFLTVGVSKP